MIVTDATPSKRGVSRKLLVGLLGSLLLALNAMTWLCMTGVESFGAVPSRLRLDRSFSRLRASVPARNDEGDKGIPQLPAFGSSSLPKDGASFTNDKPFVASRKFQLQYTCNICETRNTHNVSRIAYRNGVVIARCKGCDSQHVIADNLGWTDYDGGFRGNQTNTIEDYFAGDDTVRVNRVSAEVFQLEKILQSYNTESGSIVGDDGKFVLE